MNSFKLTNALLIALIAINGLFFIGWVASSIHRRHNHHFVMGGKSCARRHREFAFRYHHFGAFHGHYGDSRWN